MCKTKGKKILCVLLSVLMILSVFPVFSLAGSTVKVSSSKELENALNNGAEKICITKDFQLDRTFYITGETTIYSTEAHTLKRKASFGGDIFVVGENSKGKSALLSGSNASLTLGRKNSTKNDLLVFDGNQDSMTVAVKGTFLFICNSSIVNIYDNVTFQNAKKAGNKKILDEYYCVSSPSRAGGAVSMIVSGTMNVYGGIFKNNVVNDENTAEGATEEERNSTYGGAIYNYSNLNIFGGSFLNNQAARGGAVYNYRTINITKGEFDGNKATTYGGAIYQAGSQYARLYLSESGAKKGDNIVFSNNTSESNGGAVYSYLPSVVIAYGDTTFRGNASGSSGGAVAAYGTTNFNNVIFEQNKASSRGGSVYLANSTDENTTRISKITNCLFTDNTAKHGGAVATYASADTLKNGAVAEISACEFKQNNVTGDGGALYAGRKSTMSVDNCTVTGNSAVEGGGLFATDKSTVTVTKTQFTQNSAIGEDAYGGAVAVRSSVLNIDESNFDGNSADKNGGAMYIAYVGTSKVDADVSIDNSEFKANSAKKYGGAIYATHYSKAEKVEEIVINGTSFASNEALKGGAMYLTAGSITYLTDVDFNGNTNVNIADAEEDDYNGGAVYVTASTLEVDDSSFENNSSKFSGGALCADKSSNVIIKETTLKNNTAVEGGALLVTDGSATTVTKSVFTENKAEGKNAYGGAVAVRSAVLNLDKTELNKNTANKNGGAVYVSYIGTSTVNSDVNITDSVFDGNIAKSYGGAVYATQHEVTEKTEEVVACDSSFVSNEALKGGAMYLTAGVHSYLTAVEFIGNTNANIEGGDEDAYNGGALYVTASKIEINDAVFENNFAKYNGGAIGVYSEGTAILNAVTATGNSVEGEGGFLYNSGSTVNVYNSSFKKNSSAKGGGAMSLRSLGVTNVYASLFEENTAGTHGGAIYGYTGASETLLQDCSFVKNSATKYGGAVYASNASIIKMLNNTATQNNANNGGVLYETTTDTTVTISGLTVSGNTADKGAIIYGNTNKAILYLNKANYTDSDATGALDDAYWSDAIVNKLTVKDFGDEIPSYEAYTQREKIKKPTFKDKEEKKTAKTEQKKAVPVTDVFNLGKKSSDADISEEYSALKKLDNSSNFMSRNTTYFNNINNNTVTVDTFVYQAGRKANNVSVGEGLLIYQALLYKKAHPEEEVYIDISSFRFSIEAAVNINRNSRYFGYMRNLVGQDYDKYGFVRISYLLITAAKMGIHVNVIGQMDGYPISSKDPNLEEYFTNQLNDPCDPQYVKKGVIGDYLNFQYCYWTSYGDNDATDMMHTKLCAVSDYIDMNGVEHKNAVWTSSSNLDGIRDNGNNGNSKMQTATIVSDHEKIYRASSNYLRLIAEYCGQEDVYLFRDLVNKRSTEQIQLIRAGKENKIPEEEQIVYLGGPKDDVFELYFAPFGGDAVVWDEVNNPYCKYLRKMYNSDDYILFTWNNANYNNNFSLGKQIEDIFVSAFHNNTDIRNRIYLNLENFDGKVFDDLVQGKTIGYKSFNQKDFGNIHSKDMQVSYSENGKRKYVSILNSLNIHGGSMYYQSNNLLVIKEDNMDENSVFYTIADLSTKGIAENEAVDSQLAGRSFNKKNKFSIGKLSATPKTIEATIQVPKSISGRAGVIVGNYDGGSGKQLNLEVVEKGKIKLFFNTGSKKVSCVFSKDIRSDEAVNIAVTVSGNKATLYVNGVAVQTKTLSATYSGITKSFVIGGDNRKGNGRYFKGTVYSVNLFSDARTAKEIKNDCLGVAENESGLIYTTYFKISEQTYNDVKINGRTFDKTNAYSLGSPSKSPKTIEATIKVPKDIKGRAGVIVGNYNDGSGKQLNLEVYKGGKLRLFFNNGKNKVSCVFNKDLRTGAPVNVAVTIENNSATLYVNGKKTETKKLSAEYKGATKNFKVGGDNRKGNGEYFKGTIYSVKLFSDIRTKNEIRSDINYAAGYEAGLVASRIFASQKAVYSCAKLTGRDFGSNTAYELGDFTSSPKTIEAVINVPKSVDSRAGVVVGNYDGDSGKHLNLEIYSGGKVRLFFHTGSKKVTATFSKDIRSDKPVHIAVTINGKSATLYVNGVAAQTIKLSAEFKSATKNFKVGGDNRPGNPQYFKGTVYSVSLFSDVRSAKEIKRDAAAVVQNASGLIYSGNFVLKNETYEAVKATGAKYAADKFTTLEDLQNAPKTIEAVISVPKKTSGKAGVIVGNYDNSKNTQVNLEVAENGKIKLFFNTGKEKVNCIFSKDIRSGSPVHIAVTVSGKTATLYVNGERIETKTLSTAYKGATDNFRVGGDNRVGNKSYFKGTIYSVALFSDVRTSSEIRNDCNFVSANEDALLYSGRF